MRKMKERMDKFFEKHESTVSAIKQGAILLAGIQFMLSMIVPQSWWD